MAYFILFFNDKINYINKLTKMYYLSIQIFLMFTIFYNFKQKINFFFISLFLYILKIFNNESYIQETFMKMKLISRLNRFFDRRLLCWSFNRSKFISVI